MVIIDKILKAGGRVKAYDPIAMEECKRRIGNTIEYGKDMYDVISGVDALLLVTEWKEFRIPNWEIIKKTMKTPLVIDGRNIYNYGELQASGIKYHCIGRV